MERSAGAEPQASTADPAGPPTITNSEQTVDLDDLQGLAQARALTRKRGWLFTAALVLGVLWGVASAYFDVHWSWPIVLVGAYFGFAWRRVGLGSAGWAVGLTVGLYFVSAGTAWLMSQHYASEKVIQQNPAVLQAAVHLKMQVNDELPEIRGVGRLGSDAAGDLGDEVVTAFDIERLVREEIDRLSPAEQRSVLLWYYDQAGGRAGVDSQRGSWVAAAFWLIGGCWIAWRLAQHKEELDLS